MIFTITDPQAMSAPVLASWERAAVVQNQQVQRHWPGVPRITFGPGGVQVVIESVKQLDPTCASRLALGCHWPGNILTNRNSVTFTHEIIESTTDQAGTDDKREICDPVQNGSYTLKGVNVTDFAYPAWYRWGSKGPWDQAREVTRAHSSTIVRGDHASFRS